MITYDAFEGRHAKMRRIVRGALLVLAVAAGLILGVGRHSLVMMGIVLAICVVVAPAVFFLGRRLIVQARQRETEARLIINIKTYLQNEAKAQFADLATNLPEPCSPA